ncbi:MAG: glycosyltransferase family 2 protein [Bacilli bacterium]
MKPKVKFVFCILIYRNTDDLVDCIKNISEKVKNFKVVIVNSHYDDKSMNMIKKIAENLQCDFIDVPNKGYGCGNNRGIEFINNNYEYDFLIISNPDILITKFEEKDIGEMKNCVIAPLITTIKGKSQNPYWYLHNGIGEFLIYSGMLKKNKFILFIAYAINKIIREIGLYFFMKSSKSCSRIYAAHGSFVIFSSDVISKFEDLYDEKMFLFAEEALLAYELDRRGICTFLCKDVQVIHKEDGSMNIAKINEVDEERKSIIYYYRKIRKEKQNEM